MNRNLFASASPGQTPAPTDTRNAAGGAAYSQTPEATLAMLALTGTFGDSFYTKASAQLADFITWADRCAPEFVAKLAVYARHNGKMKDTPAALVAYLACRGHRDLAAQAFVRAIDNGRMLRGFIQVIRSGVMGRKSLGTATKRLVRSWFESRDAFTIFRQSIGAKPSLGDILKLSHPKPHTEEHRALYGYLTDGDHYDASMLPGLVRAYEDFKVGLHPECVPAVPWEMLTSLPLKPIQWRAIALQATWTQLRMNLNTFARHGVFSDQGITAVLVQRLGHPDAVRTSRVLPYQLLTAFKSLDPAVPAGMRLALQDAMEVAVERVPALPGNVVVAVDVSGSMSAPVTGHRGTATTATTCTDVAGLMASAILRHNPSARVIPFDTGVRAVNLNPRDSVMTNAQKLAMHGGGTDVSSPIRALNAERANVDLVVMLSDNESWSRPAQMGRYTAPMVAPAAQLQIEWNALKARNPRARMVCVDLAPTPSVQAQEGNGVRNIGGFSDDVFGLIAGFAAGQEGSTEAPQDLTAAVMAVTL